MAGKFAYTRNKRYSNRLNFNIKAAKDRSDPVFCCHTGAGKGK